MSKTQEVRFNNLSRKYRDHYIKIKVELFAEAFPIKPAHLDRLMALANPRFVMAPDGSYGIHPDDQEVTTVIINSLFDDA